MLSPSRVIELEYQPNFKPFPINPTPRYISMTDFHFHPTGRGAPIVLWLDQLPSYPPKTFLSLASLPTNNMISDTDMDDPWDWPVDRVVQELCTSNRTWTPRTASMRGPDPTFLEQALRENDVDGSILLVNVDEEAIRRDLNVKSLGRRAFLEDCIIKLRECSTQYQAYLNAHAQPRPLINTSISYRSSDFQPDAHSEGIRSSAGYALAHDGQKRRKLDLAITHNDDHEPAFAPMVESDIPQDDPASNDDGKKRKRIAPTLITSVIDVHRDCDMPTKADNLVQYDSSGTEDVDRDRMEVCNKLMEGFPNGQNSDSEDQVIGKQKPLAPHISSRKAPDDLAGIGYLGKKKMRVDDLFYQNTPIGKELSDTDESPQFYLANQKISSGRRLYVHGIMRKFLRSEPDIIIRDNKLCYAVYPYTPKLAPKFQDPSFTLYYGMSNGTVHAKRMEYNPDNPIQTGDEHTATFNPLGPGMVQGLGAPDEWNESFLEKYKQLEDGDRVLPLYGESDEENEYDLATWKEIEEERGKKLDRPERKTGKPHITYQEVNEAIDEGIAELVLKWKSKVLPKRQLEAWTLWKKSRHRKDKKAQISQAKKDRAEKLQRIAKMRKEIASDVWTSKSQVRRQTQIMEIDVFAREDLSWKLSTLELKACPEKLLSQATLIPSRKVPSAKTDDIEEGELIETDTEGFSFDDEELNDFIIPDEVADSVEVERHELNLADSERDMDQDDDAFFDASEVLAVTPHKTSFKAKKATKLDENSTLDEDADSSEVESSTNVVKYEEPSSLPKLQQTVPNNTQEIIDLTRTSSDDNSNTPRVINLVTPRKSRIKIINRQSPFSSPIVLSDVEELILDLNSLPSMREPALIARYSFETWEKIDDRERLVIKVVYSMDTKSRLDVFDQFSSNEEGRLWNEGVKVVILALLNNKENVKGVDQGMFKALAYITSLWHIYNSCKHSPWRQVISHDQLTELLNTSEKKFPPFYRFCHKLEDYFARRSVSSEPSMPSPMLDRSMKAKNVKEVHANKNDTQDDDDEEPRPPPRRHSREVTASDEDIPNERVSNKKRKKRILENEQARSLREADRLRIIEQDQRRKELQADLARTGASQDDDDRERIIVNDAAAKDQDIIYVNPHIGACIKKHQIEGLRFMWNQIVAASRNEESMQGCLLAHTMGLGKTMQVITLLVSIAEASTSPDPATHLQVPECLRASKTLILCPPGLINNWMDELYKWVPHPDDILGGLWKVDASLSPKTRLKYISNWSREGGVLVLGYEMLRRLITNKPSKGQEPPLSEEEHEEVERNLLEGPNIIVADEAHKMKSAKAQITLVASKFRAKSRIALTGSPLANNVEEYHAMIEWVAPNYLGPIVEFRSKYVEPIQTGLYSDSTSYERRKALKMLGVLKEDIGPKVHRADMSVLRNDLPPKKEFVITVPLTDIQRKLYSLYVDSVTSGAVVRTKTGDVAQTTIWHWLSVLSILCNHPDCFKSKLEQRNGDAKKNGALATPDSSRDTADLEEQIAAALNAPKVGVSQALVDEANKIFSEVGDLTSIELSNKAKILCQILDASAAAGDKVLVFSQSIPTLDFLERLCVKQTRKYSRLDGRTNIANRQKATKDFNQGNQEVYLISTTAGGLGLNLFGANRVVIFDFKWNPIHEEQAVGRAYRIGQEKTTFVYRFLAGGTFEDGVHNATIFKMQLASRVVDKKSPVAYASKKLGEFLFRPKDVAQESLEEFKGMDPEVLDKVLSFQVDGALTISKIVQTDTFERDDDDKLSPAEEKEVKQMINDEQLKRSDPQKYQEVIAKRAQQAIQQVNEIYRQSQTVPFHPPVTPNGAIPLNSQTNLGSGGSAIQAGRNAGNAVNATPVVEQSRPRFPPRPRSVLSTGQPSASSTMGNARGSSPIPGVNTKDRPHTPPSPRTPKHHDVPGSPQNNSTINKVDEVRLHSIASFHTLYLSNIYRIHLDESSDIGYKWQSKTSFPQTT